MKFSQKAEDLILLRNWELERSRLFGGKQCCRSHDYLIINLML